MAVLAAGGLLATLGTVATIAGTAVSVMGQLAAGKAAAAQGANQQRIAEFQAKSQEQQGKLQFANAQARADQRREQLAFALSRKQAVESAGGFDPLSAGSQARGEQLFEAGELAALQEISSGFIQRQQAETGATLSRAGGAAAFAAGQTAKSTAGINAASTVIGGASTLAGQFSTRSFQQQQLAALSGSGGGGGSGNFFNSSIFKPTGGSQTSSRFVPGLSIG